MPGVGIPDINQKIEPRTGYQINQRSGATGKKASTERTFKKIVAFNGRSASFDIP
jgi:hypothetical protein